MQNVSVISNTEIRNAGEFVPSVAYLNGRKADVVFRTQLGPVEIVGADRQGSFLRIQLASGDIYKCKAETFGGSDFPVDFLMAIREAYQNAELVELAVAVKPGGRAAPEYFCGLRLPQGRVTRDLSGTCNL
jgi:hypothetical protein